MASVGMITPKAGAPASQKAVPVSKESAFYQATEMFKLSFGLFVSVAAGPFVAFQVFMCTVWEAVDKRSINMIGLVQKASAKVAPSFICKHPEDGFIAHLFIWLGVVLPMWFFYELYVAYAYGFSWSRIMVYNLIRIGPMYMNFMNIYVLCHKEAHNFGNLFSSSYNKYLKYVFNHWAGMFHGVVPGTFTYSHIYNHHKYDNDHRDVYSTAFRPRDEVTSFIKYITEWFGYASNISTVKSFIGEGRYKLAMGTTLSTLYYLAFVAVCGWIHPFFTLWTLVYAFVEGNILLAVVNFVWHAFIDENDPSNDYINSTTVVEGMNFTLGEEYHVVHHQYAGAHWTRHEELYLKHMEQYKACVPSSFHKANLFEIFGLIVSKQYGMLADMYYKPFWPEGMTRDQMALLLKQRLQSHGPELAQRVGRTHKAKQLSEGEGEGKDKTK